MASQRTTFTVGLFVIVGFGIAVVAIVWLGMSPIFEKGRFYATYFDESVQGLDKDSQVKYRGVSIGRVERIGVAPDSRLIEVVLKVESDQILENDIVAQLKIVGITGSMFIELDRKKAGEPDRSPSLSFASTYEVLASKPSDISELLRGFDAVFSQIKALDLKGISDGIKETLENTNRLLVEADIKRISKNLNLLIVQVNQTVGRVEKLVAENEKGILAAISDFSEALDKANDFFSKGATLLSGTDESISQLKRHLLVVGQNLERASENLDRLIELVSDQPSQLLLGEPPVARKIEPEPPSEK